MSVYKLFGEKITFTESADRWLKYQQMCCDDSEEVAKHMMQWYKESQNILEVLDTYQEMSWKVIQLIVVENLYQDILDLEIYDISKQQFCDLCFKLKSSDAAFDNIAGKYNYILEQQGEAAENRVIRKENRGLLVGGGFGLRGAAKGIVKAGAVNALTGAGHNAVNAIGNIGSSIQASLAKRNLYEDTKTVNILIDAVKADLIDGVNSFIQCVNERRPEYIKSFFDTNRSIAFLENAERLANDVETSKMLLIKAFKNMPWYKDIYVYIFMNFNEERKNILTIAEQFSVDLSETIKKVLAEEYSDKEKESEENALQAKVKILKIMEELGIEESETLDELEKDCLIRIVNQSEERACLIKRIEEYGAEIKNKKVIIKEYAIWELSKKFDVEFTPEEIEEIIESRCVKEKYSSKETLERERVKALEIMEYFHVEESKTLNLIEVDYVGLLCQGYESADETTCNQMISVINSYEGKEGNKKIGLEKVGNRIKEIWYKEDFEAFKRLYLELNYEDVEGINRVKKYIEEAGRTTAKYEFIIALDSLRIENIRIAANYVIAKQKGGLSGLFNFTKGDVYKKLTLDKRIMHPNIDEEVIRIKENEPKKTGLFSKFINKND